MPNIDKKNVRYNVLIIIVYLIGILLLLQLFNLQIVHGEEYYAKSSARLTRETTIDAARGDIKDRNGVQLASTEARNSLEIYKSKVDNLTLNNTILNIITILEKNKDEYKDSFPIDIKKMEFTIKDEELKNWKEVNEIDEALDAKQVLNYYKEKYEVAKENIEDIRKIVGVRYGIEKEGYTSMRAYVISEDISLASVAEIEEQNQSFSGISIYSSALRKYNMGSLASHILGYIGPISPDELKNNQDYSMNDYIGKNGVESVFENYLKGEDRNKTNRYVDRRNLNRRICYKRSGSGK